MCGKAPNPLPSLGVPGVQLPTALGGASLQGNGNVAPGSASNIADAAAAAAAAASAASIKATTPVILSQLGRGVLDTTILGQARRAPSNLATATTLGGS